MKPIQHNFTDHGHANGHANGDGQPPFTIVSKLAHWDSSASVRTKPRRMLQDDEAAGKLFFTPELVPVARHPLVEQLGPETVRALQVRHLYRYLDFTTRLELDVINGVASDIALGKAAIDLPDVMRADAFRLCTDESHHAYFSDDMRRQVIEATGITPEPSATPSFLRRLRAIRRGLPRDERRLSAILFAVVSETLISGILAQIPRDERVVTGVREIVADHAEDEGRHCAFFSQFFTYLWPQVERGSRTTLGPLLPEFIIAFLEPDTRVIQRSLAALPLGPYEVGSIIAEAYPLDQLNSSAREAAAITLHLFEHNEVMDDPRIADAFRERGLID